MGRQVDYDDYQPYVKNGPMVDLTLHGPGGPNGATTAQTAHAIVDAGADYVQLEVNLALYVGLDPVAQGTPVWVATAGGPVKLHELVVDLEFLGQILPVTVHFGSGAAPLLGLQGLFQAVQAAGFDRKEWLQQWHPTAPATATQSNDLEDYDLESDGPEVTLDTIPSVRRQRRPSRYPKVNFGKDGKAKITWVTRR